MQVPRSVMSYGCSSAGILKLGYAKLCAQPQFLGCRHPVLTISLHRTRMAVVLLGILFLSVAYLLSSMNLSGFRGSLAATRLRRTTYRRQARACHNYNYGDVA
jgi:hypothetical protein